MLGRPAQDRPQRLRAWPLRAIGALACCCCCCRPALALAVRSTGYSYTDPSPFGGLWLDESLAERQLDPAACACASAGPVDVPWEGFQADLRENLAADPLFSGAWVHALCSDAYATVFRFAAVDPQTGHLRLAGTACAAGLAAMAAVCAQSAALRGQARAPWRWHERVAREEGTSVGDFMGRVPLGECLRLCEAREGCASLAHGPHGCHLKGRCSRTGDALRDPAESADGYRTYFLDPCPLASDAATTELGGEGEAGEEAATLLGELTLLLDLAVQLAERAVHCVDGSGWPFSPRELLANRIQLAEVTLGAGGAGGAEAELRSFTWTRLPATAPGEALGSEGAVHRSLERARMRWARRLNSEVGFWHILLDPNRTAGAAAGRSEEDAELVRHWVESGEVRWSWDEGAALCGLVAAARAAASGAYGPPRVLNTGSGPLAPGPLDCGAEGHASADEAGAASLGAVPVAASDGLARFYLRVFDQLGIQPPRAPAHCPVEELRHCFPRNHFDLVHMRNALDHTMDPLQGLRQMLHVVRPGGWVLLRHARNEGSPGQFQLGLHQWSFDGRPVEEGGPLHFVIWNPALHADATRWLLQEGLAQEVHTELRPHPGRPSPEDASDEYVWVDIRKPL